MTYKQVRNRIGELVPDVMKLVFGCEVKSSEYGEGIILRKSKLIPNSKNLINYDVHYFSVKSYTKKKLSDGKVEILGRDPSLADVLRAIEKSKGQKVMTKKKEHIVVDTNGDFVSGGHYTKTGYIKYAKWDLSKPLSGQSQETLDFLGGLIK